MDGAPSWEDQSKPSFLRGGMAFTPAGALHGAGAECCQLGIPLMAGIIKPAAGALSLLEGSLLSAYPQAEVRGALLPPDPKVLPRTWLLLALRQCWSF